MPLPLNLDRTSPEALYRQVERQLRHAIETGRLRAGERLPSVRNLAADLDVGRLTAATAYEQLAADGYVISRVGFGTVVAPDAPVATESARSGGQSRPQAAGAPVRRAPIHHRAALRVADSLQAWPAGGTARYDLRTRALGGPGVAVGPVLERLLREAWRDLVDGSRPDTHPAGDPLLRAAIAGHLRTARGARCEPEQVVILSGAVAGVAAIARLWLAAGRSVVVDDPGDPALHRALALGGGTVVARPVDRHGLRVEDLPDAAVALTSPTVQSATGVRMPLARRLRLLAWAAETGAILVEDGRSDELAVDAPVGPSLQGLDEDGRVIHLGGFAAILHPGVQMAYAVVPGDLVEPFVASVSALDPGATPVQQHALGRYLADGHLDRHLQRVRRALAQRYEGVLDAARRELGWLVAAEAPGGGTRVVLGIEDPAWTASGVAAEAAQVGVALETLAAARTRPAGDRELVVDVGRHEPAELRRAIALVGKAVATKRAARSRPAWRASSDRAPVPLHWPPPGRSTAGYAGLPQRGAGRRSETP